MGTDLHIPGGKPLSDAVQLFWQVGRYNPYRKEVIIPKGIVEIIFNLSPETAFHARLYNGHFSIPKCFIQGYHTGPITLELPRTQLLFGAVLHTAATKYIFRMSAGELTRQCIDLTLIDPSVHSLWHQLAGMATFRERTVLLSDWLTKRIPCLSPREQALNDLLTIKTNKPLSVSGLSDWLCYSPRHLSRKFHELSGMNTEQTILYLKYLKAKKLVHHSGMTLSQIAYACEFSDQPHFTKTFKSFARLTPKEYRNRKSGIEGHYFENVR